MHIQTTKTLIRENWKSGITVALISVPLSIALSIASGAGPVPGLITGVWATLLASVFGSSNYNIIGPAGALTTVLFAATIAVPEDVGVFILPLLAVVSGVLILIVWVFRADRFLNYVPSSVIYGFSAGVAILIAASQLFDAAGLSALKRTGHFIGDIELFAEHLTDVHRATLMVFGIFLAFILAWKRYVKSLPAVIPASVLGIIFGFIEASRFDQGLISLSDKFGQFSGALFAAVPWHGFTIFLENPEAFRWLLKTGGVVALIAILETLITAKIGDSITKTQSSSSKELLGLAVANISSGLMGGLPATGVFLRTGANIRAKATHKMSATICAVATGVIAVIVLPLFSYIPMAVIAALLVNTAIGLIETEKFKEFWHYEKSSFWISLVVVFITVLEDAGIAVVVGALLALLSFAESVSHGRFDVILNYADGKKEDVRGKKNLHIGHGKEIEVCTYSIAGSLNYIDSGRHAANLRHIAHNPMVKNVILRLRDLYSIDFEGREMLKEAIETLHNAGKPVYISSIHTPILDYLRGIPVLNTQSSPRFFPKTGDALAAIRGK